MRAFQIKINHNIYHTNEKLLRIGRAESAYCTFGCKLTETLDHLFFQCSHVRAVWEKISETLTELFDFSTLKNNDLILGVTDKVGESWTVVNHIILLFKYAIHSCRIQERKPNLKSVI